MFKYESLLYFTVCFLQIQADVLNITEKTFTPNLKNEEVLNDAENEIFPQTRHGYAETIRIRNKESLLHLNLDKSLLDMNLRYCQRPAKCVALNDSHCMGVKLPYQSTTFELTDLNNEAVLEHLRLYTYLQYVPKCWAVVQPFLCALFLPKCEDGKVDLPSREMCKVTLKPCKIFYDFGMFPEFIRCDDERLFPSPCKNDIHELKFNITGTCMEPLVKTEQPYWFYPDIEGCGLQCKDSLYTEDEHNQIHKLIAYCVVLCILLNLFTVVTFIIDWKMANKYPALAIFYINICFLISYCGWSVQFLGSETREDVVCKKDGTLRMAEPSASENLSCVIVFVMVYYFLVAGIVWFVIFTYAWHRSSLQALGKIQERVDKKRAYFHLVAWSLPLILTITTMALCEIDGNYVTGICFVGFTNRAARAGLFLAPLAAAMLVSEYITIRGLILLIRVKIDSRDIISEHSSSKIRSNIVRMGVFALFIFVFCIITFVYHGYHSANSESWQQSLQTYIQCKLTSLSEDYSHCRQESRPSVAMLQLQLLAVFGAGLGMASWVWCSATFHSWARYIRKKFHCEVDEPMKLQKHKIIAQAFAQRRKFNQVGRISIDFQNHTDPVGLHFELNSGACNELSTTWAQNLPRFVNRRGAVPNEVTSNNQSIDSEVSYSVRHVSIESRRNSGDSQLSVQIAEVTATRKGRRSKNLIESNRRRRRFKKRGSKDFGRSSRTKGSATSLDSHIGQQILNVLTNAAEGKRSAVPNLKRRAGNAGLDGHLINNLLSNGKLVIPCNANVCSGSEDENVSVTISESKFNVVVSNHSHDQNMDLNDELVMKSLRQGLKIEEVHSSSDSVASSKKDREYEKEKRFSKKHKAEYSSASESFDSDSSSSPELKKLVQTSLNSGVSVGYEKNRGSKQSKTSIDVAVQANACDIVSAYEMEDLKKNKVSKSKKAKTKENTKYKKYRKYEKYGSDEEKQALRREK